MTNSCDQDGPRSLLATADIVASDYPTAVVKVKLDGPGVVVVVGGETDTSNASGYIHRSMPDCPAVILDVNDVRFLGVQGLRALMVLGAECGRAGVACAVVVSQSIIRLLRLMRRGDLLPTVASLAEALQQISVEADAERR